MIDIQARAEEYAKDRLKYYPDSRIPREDVTALIAEAYEQGYIDCDTKDDKPETQDEFLDEAPDCRYFSEGNCAKGLPGIPCNRVGCAAYYPKDGDEELIDYLSRKNAEAYENARRLWLTQFNERIPCVVNGETLKDIDYSVNIPKETK